jgi:Trehalose utilisation
MLLRLWVRSEKWSNFVSNSQGRLHVQMTVDERTSPGGVMGADHPLAWSHASDGGQAWDGA